MVNPRDNNPKVTFLGRSGYPVQCVAPGTYVRDR
jgi:hypothetical protein